MEEVQIRFKNGDPDAVRTIYRQYSGAVTTIARSIVDDPELANEIVQQTFLKAWRAASSFDSSRELTPWLYSIARRTAIDAARKEQRPTQGGHEPETDVAIETISFERTWEIFEIRSSIDALPDGEREVIKASHLLGLSHPEIAERLGIPVGTVKSRSARAHKRLASALGHLTQSANHSDDENV